MTAALVGLKSRPAVFAVQRRIGEYAPEPLLAVLPGVAMDELAEGARIAPSGQGDPGDYRKIYSGQVPGSNFYLTGMYSKVNGGFYLAADSGQGCTTPECIRSVPKAIVRVIGGDDHPHRGARRVRNRHRSFARSHEPRRGRGCPRPPPTSRADPRRRQ